MTRVAISQPMYFPWAGFLEQMKLTDIYVWLDDAQFSKGSFTNRIKVILPGKQVWMTVPLARKTGVEIRALDAHGIGWISSHRSLLEQSFEQSEHFDMAIGMFDEATKHKRLVDLLIASAEVPAAALNAKPRRILRSSNLGIGGSGSARVLEIVRHLGGTRYVTGHGAANYLDMEAFEKEGVEVEFMDYQVRPWPQRELEAFTPYVTALDLVAARGPLARAHLRPRVVPWREFLNKRRILL